MEGAHRRHSPPAGFTVRPARHEDIREIIALMDALDVAFGHVAMSLEIDDIENDWSDLNTETDTWVVVAPGGALAAYGLVNDEGLGQFAADGYVHPDWRGHGLGALLLHLAETRARELVDTTPTGARVTLMNSVLAEDDAARTLLESKSFSLARVFWRM